VRTDEFNATLAGVRAILEERWDTELMDERTVGFTYLAGPIPVSCYCELNLDMRGFIFRGIFALPFPPELRAAAAEYLHRVNYPIPIGNWAIDLDTGDVRWKMGIYFGDGDLTPILVREVIDASLYFIYQHVFGLVKLHNGKPLTEALAAVGEDHGEGAAPRKRGEA
jgi:hypothetical protein